MKEELTTAMHEEFQVNEETDRRLNALSLAEMERAGIPVTEECLEDRGLTWVLYEHYKDMFVARHGFKK